MSSFEERDLKSRAWGMASHFVDLRNLEKAEYAEAKLHAQRLVDIIVEEGRLVEENPINYTPGDVTLDYMLEKVTEKKSQMMRPLFPSKH